LFGILKNTYVDETDYKKYLEDKYLWKYCLIQI
jgi:hypothetical protein